MHNLNRCFCEYLHPEKKEENSLRGVFNPDSPMMRALGVVWDLIVLNLLFLVCCIPVVTIGPAITALHYVTTKMAGEKDGTPVVGNFSSHSGQISARAY